MRKIPFCFFIICVSLILIDCDSDESVTTPQTGNSDFTLMWKDEFESSLGSRWNIANWTFGNNRCEFGRNMVSIDEGALHLGIARKVENRGKYPDKPYWGAEVYTSEEYQYGKFETVMQPLTPSGVVTSFFLMNGIYDPDGNMLDWFEIDIEFPGTTKRISYALHWFENGQLNSTAKEVELEFDASDAPHTYSIVWQPDSIAFFVDSTQTALFDNPNIMKQLQHPMSIHMNYWVSNSSAWVGPFYESVLPIQTVYESVAFYKPN